MGNRVLERRTRLLAFSGLADADRTSIDLLLDQRQRTIAARRDVVSEGHLPHCVHFLLEGWGCRYRQLRDGRRQILALLLPGDMFDANVQVLAAIDHSISAITPMTIAEVAPETVSDLIRTNPAIARAIWWNDHVCVATQREWTATLGMRTARERIAHLLCEVYFRLRLMGRCVGRTCEFPLTQVDVGEATGLTPVHVNRMVQELRRERLIEWAGRTLTILDLDGLCEVAQFAPAYLHLDRTVPADAMAG